MKGVQVIIIKKMFFISKFVNMNTVCRLFTVEKIHSLKHVTIYMYIMSMFSFVVLIKQAKLFSAVYSKNT